MTEEQDVDRHAEIESKPSGDTPCMITLLLSSFLQDGQMGSCRSSFFSVDEPSAGVESADREGADEV